MVNEGDFFVMLNTQDGGYTPMTTTNDTDQYEIAKFKTEDEARSSAKNNLLGWNFGYEVFEIGMGL